MEDMSPDQTEIVPCKTTIQHHLEVQTRRWHEVGAHEWPSLEIRMLAPGSSPLTLKYRPDAIGQAADDIAHWNEKGRNAYSVRNPINANCGGSAKDGDILAAFACFADCDEEHAAEALTNFVGPKYTYAITTGTRPHMRPHPYWELADPITDLAAWSDLQKRIAARLRSDPVVHNPSRIMRIAGTVTWPDDRKRDRGYVSELVTMRLDYPDPRHPVPFDQLQRAFPEAQPGSAGPSGNTITATGMIALDRGVQAMDRALVAQKIAAGDHWHENVIRLVASYVSKGLGDTEIHAITDAFTLDGYTVEQTRAEVQKAIDGARAKGWTPTETTRTFDHAPRTADAPAAAEILPAPDAESTWEMQSTADFTADFVAPEYIVEGIIQRGRMYTLTAPTGHGKTATMLYMATHIASGSDVCAKEVEKGDVIFLAGENPDDVRARTIAALEAYDLSAEGLSLHWIAGTFSIRQDMARLVEMIGKLPNVVCIIVDTFAAYFDGDNENDNAQALDFARMLRTLTQAHSKPCIVMPAHPVKNATRSTLTPKGGSSLLNEVDGNLTIWNDDGLLTVHWQGKHRGPDFEPLTLELEKYETAAVHDRHGRLMPTVVARPVLQMRAMEISGKTISKETLVLQSIDRNPGLPIRERAVECALTRSSLTRTIERMMQRKWLRKKGRKHALTEQGEEAMRDGMEGVSDAEIDD